MPAILVFGNFLLIYLTLRKCQETDWRESYLLAAAIFGVLLTTFTEALSFLNWLYFLPLAVAWGLAFLAVFILYLKAVRTSPGQSTFPEISELTRTDILLLAPAGLIVIWVAILAWTVPPNTWDSMTYHMSRVMHWMQNRSIAFYPTHFLPQLHHNPWSEFAILHLQILSGSDRLANFVQWFSMTGSLIGVSLIAKTLGANRRGQILASVFCATIPMGIMQGSSTQTDYVCSFWIVCFAYFSIRSKNKCDFISLMAAGLTLGLAILTKATAYLFAFPFSVWLLITLISRFGIKRGHLVLLPFVIALLINLGHYSRNIELHGNPLGTLQEDNGFKYVNPHINITGTFVSLLENIGLHLATPVEPLNTFTENLIRSTHNAIKTRAELETDSVKPKDYYIPRISVSEDSTGNLIYIFLIPIALYLYLVKQTRDSISKHYLILWLSGFILFSAILSWQPWGSRLQLPFFVIGTPFLGLVFSKVHFPGSAKINYAKIFIALLYLSSLPWMLMSFTKPVFRNDLNIFKENRIEQYFAANPSVRDTYTHAAEYIRDSQCNNIGVVIEKDRIFYEYPFWVLLNNNQPEGLVKIHNMKVFNHSKIFSDNEKYTETACAILTVSPASATNLPASFHGYTFVGKFGELALYKAE